MRRWKSYRDATPDEFDHVVELVSKRFGVPLLDLQNAVDYAWETALTSDEEGIFTEAYRRETESPIELFGNVSPSFQRVASFAYYMWVLGHGEPFHVAAEKLGHLLGFSQQNRGMA